MSTWHLVENELSQWRNELLPVRLWLRDDDAVEPTKELEQLVDLTAQFNIPINLAVIPKLATEALAHYLKGHTHISIGLHGYLHKNQAPHGQKKCELGLYRGKQIMCDELASGQEKLSQMFGEQYFNMLVPPWNRIDAQLVPELSTLGIKSISTFGWEDFPTGSKIAQLNTHLDIIDWKGTRGGRPAAELISDLAMNLKIARQNGGAPVGILSHHLVHDNFAWEFLQILFEFSRQRKDIKWYHAASLLEVSTG